MHFTAHLKVELIAMDAFVDRIFWDCAYATSTMMCA
jgi:hypothetical protein